MRTKICSACKQDLPLDNFCKSKGGKFGLHNYCRPCQSKARRARYQAHKESELARGRQWQKDNEYWLTYLDDPVRRERRNAWRRSTNRSIEKSKRRALELGANGSHSLEEWYSLCKRYGNKCLRCERPDAKLTQDHVVPLSRGGANSIDNIQPLCGPCNSAKGTRTIDYRIDQ